jgi:hypothetical protein
MRLLLFDIDACPQTFSCGTSLLLERVDKLAVPAGNIVDRLFPRDFV